MGINVDATISFTFVVGTALAGIGGILYGFAYPQINVFMGIMPGIKSFIAAVLGGIGLVHGAVLGGLVIGVAEVFVSAYLSSTFRDGFIFIILILVLLVKAERFFRKKERQGMSFFEGAKRFLLVSAIAYVLLKALFFSGFATAVHPADRPLRPHHDNREPRPQRHLRVHGPVLPRSCRLLRHRRLCVRMSDTRFRQSNRSLPFLPILLVARSLRPPS